MMMNKTPVALLLACLAGTEAFSPIAKVPRPSLVVLNNIAMLSADAEDDATYLMQKARECAFSDSCSVDDAKTFLREVVHVQSGCAAGTLVGHELCEDQDQVAEIVANLRQKIEEGSSSLATVQRASVTALGGVALASLFLAAVAVLSTQPQLQADVVPFTLQEWWWSIKGGYLNTMLSHYARHGGLSSLNQADVVPFTPQEWIWAFQGGYLDTMFSHFVQNGGLSTVDASPEDAALPFTLQEWGWAIKGGYLDDMVSHYMRNGGV